MVKQCEALSSATVSVTINERDVLKLVLEFLECRRFHIAQLALERETGIINGKFTEDVLFLRQLILDGQWDSALDFVKPLKELERFRAREFNFLIYKYKYFELLCLKQEPGPLQDNEFTVEEIVQCLRELEKLSENGDEFRQLCALLTLPKLSDHEHFRNWNPSSARCECFRAVLPIVGDSIDQLNLPKESDKEEEEKHSNGERLIQLVVKGLLYEYAVDYCQKQAIEGKNAAKPKFKFTDLLNGQHSNLSSNDLSLISWLEVLSNEQFTVPFHQRAFNFHLEALKKPRLDAQWTEQILATPIKPHGQFPYSLVPHTKFKSAQQQLSQSISVSMVFEPGFHRSSREDNDRLNFRTCSMSKSTFPSIGVFSIQKLMKNGNAGEGERPHSLGNEAMRQSQIISDMLSESSAPSTARRSPPLPQKQSSLKFQQVTNPDSQHLSIIGSSSPPSFSAESENLISGAGAARQELEAFCRRNPPQSLPLNNKKTANPMTISASSTLPPVSESNTPIGCGSSTTLATINEGNLPISQHLIQSSRLFQEFQANQQQNQKMIPYSFYQQMSHQQLTMPLAISAPQCHQLPLNYTTMPPIVEQQFAIPQQTMIGQYQQQMVPPPSQQIVMMRTPQQNPNNYIGSSAVDPPPMSSRPMSMIIPQSSINQGQLNSNRPHSYLDQPYLLPDPLNWQQNAGSQYYSMMSTIPVEDGKLQQPRKGSLDDEEFLEEENQGESNARDGRTNERQSMASPVRFVPICRYEDAQAIRAVAFHPSGGHFAIGTNSRQLLLCRYPDLNAAYKNLPNPPSPEILLARPKQHRGSVYCATFNQTGELLATGSNDKTIRLMSVQIDADRCRIGAELELQRMHDGTVRDLIFMEERLSGGGSSQQSNVLVSGGAGNCNIYVTDCNKGQTFQHFQGHIGPILGLNNWGSSTNFVSCSQDKTIRFWDLRASAATSVIWPTPKTSNSPVTSICIDPSGKLLISGHEDATIMLFDICGGRTIQLFRPHGDEIRTVRLSNAAYYLLSGSYDKRIVITDMRGNLAEPLDYLPVAEHQDKVIQCRWHPQDFVFLSTSADKCAILWSLPPFNID